MLFALSPHAKRIRKTRETISDYLYARAMHFARRHPSRFNDTSDISRNVTGIVRVMGVRARECGTERCRLITAESAPRRESTFNRRPCSPRLILFPHKTPLHCCVTRDEIKTADFYRRGGFIFSLLTSR